MGCMEKNFRLGIANSAVMLCKNDFPHLIEMYHYKDHYLYLERGEDIEESSKVLSAESLFGIKQPFLNKELASKKRRKDTVALL